MYLWLNQLSNDYIMFIYAIYIDPINEASVITNVEETTNEEIFFATTINEETVVTNEETTKSKPKFELPEFEMPDFTAIGEEISATFGKLFTKK